MIPKSETNGGDDMADIAKKITKLDEKIGKLKERIQTDTAECEKLSEQKALLIYQSLCKQYSCEGQALADMIAREHEQAVTSGADDEPVSDISSHDEADEEEMQCAASTKRWKTAIWFSLRRKILTRIKIYPTTKRL